MSSSSSSSEMVNIAGLDKVQLLHALWTRSKPAAYYDFSMANPPSFNVVLANDGVKRYIDYFQGRCIKTDLSKNEANPRMFDRDFGQGAFAQVVADLRK